MVPTLPIVCDPTIFSTADRHRHRERTKELLLERPTRRDVLEQGIEFHYVGGNDLFLSLAEWVAVEHRCCPWARFTVEMDPFAAGEPGDVRLRITGGTAGIQLLLDSLEQLSTGS